MALFHFPQMCKYKHLNSLIFAKKVIRKCWYWNRGNSKKCSILGRDILQYIFCGVKFALRKFCLWPLLFGPRSSKFPCRNTIYRHFFLAKLQILKVVGGGGGLPSYTPEVSSLVLGWKNFLYKCVIAWQIDNYLPRGVFKLVVSQTNIFLECLRFISLLSIASPCWSLLQRYFQVEDNIRGNKAFVWSFAPIYGVTLATKLGSIEDSKFTIIYIRR